MKINVKIFARKHLLLFEICAREICEKFVYIHSQAIEYVKNYVKCVKYLFTNIQKQSNVLKISLFFEKFTNFTSK